MPNESREDNINGRDEKHCRDSGDSPITTALNTLIWLPAISYKRGPCTPCVYSVRIGTLQKPYEDVAQGKALGKVPGGDPAKRLSPAQA